MSELDAKGFVKFVSIGALDLELIMVVNEFHCEKFHIPPANEINSISDLKKFVSPEEEIERKEEELHIYDLIRLTTNNAALNSLLFVNRAFKKKTFIEFLALTNLIFNEDEKFIMKIVKHVTEMNFLFLMETSICEMPSKIKFTIKYEVNRSDCKNIKSFYFESVGKENKISPNTKLYDALSYDFDFCNYFFFDLNGMLQFTRYGLGIKHFNDFIKYLAEENPETNIMVNYPDNMENTSNLNLNTIGGISEIINFTDTFLFERKDALALFNNLTQLSGENDNKNEKKNLELVFLKDIKKKRKNFPKIGLFFDEFKRLTVIEQQSKNDLVLFHTDFEFDLIPKTVTTVVQDEYRKLLTVNYSMLKFVFIGGFFSRLFYKKSFKTCFTAGSESVKRITEVFRFDLDFPIDNNYYLIRIKKHKKETSEQNKNLDQFNIKKEQHFVLDCMNLKTSKMIEYNPLYDDSLQSYFSSIHIKKHLKKTGFINKKGEILQDPDYKKLGILKNDKLQKLYEDEQSNLIKIKENNYKMKLQINNLFHGSVENFQNLNLTELEKLAKVYNFNQISGRKLPSIRKSNSSPTRNDLYAKAIAENKKDCILINIANKDKLNGRKNLKPLTKETYMKMLDSIEVEKKSEFKNEYNKNLNTVLNDRTEAPEKTEEIKKVKEPTQDYSSSNLENLENLNNNSKDKVVKKESKIVNISLRSVEKSPTPMEKENNFSKIEKTSENDKESSIINQKEDESSNLIEKNEGNNESKNLIQNNEQNS